MNKFESYKETKIEWIGKIPSHWQLARVGKYFNERNEKVDDVTYPPLSVTMSGIVDQLSEVAKTNDGDNRKLAKKNDYVINSRSDRKGSSGISPRDGSISLINIVLEPQKKLNPDYIQYLFKSYYFKEEFFRNGKGIHWDLWTTRWEQFKNIKIPIPSSNEQKLITHYLDKKTKHADRLVEMLQKKIELLKEQRASLINRCVTKGLDPNCSMKDSGVEWIGEIPSSWQIVRLGMLGVFTSSGIDKKLKEDEVPVRMVNFTDLIKGRNYFSVQTGEKEYMKVTTSQSKLHEHRLEKGDMVFLPSSETYEDLGYSSLIDFDEKDIVYSYHIIRFKTTKSIHHYYKKYFTNCHSILNQFSIESKGTTRKIIGKNVFKNVRVVLPSINEQQQIVSYLDKHTQLVDKTVSLEEKRIELIKKYRESLITNVVTGKFKITENMT